MVIPLEFKPHPYQQHCIEYMLKRDYAALFLDMGLGKTVTSLTVSQIMLEFDPDVNKILVIAPLKVTKVWLDEVLKWDHLHDLKISRVTGNAKQRIKALATEADIYVINRENVQWLIVHYNGRFPFDMLILDELSSFKNHASKRFKYLKKVLPLVKKVYGLTGTPSPNGYIDLWAQVYLLDRGKSLGKNITEFRQRYCTKNYSGFGFSINGKKNEEKIRDAIAPFTVSMQAKDYLQMPDKIVNFVKIEFTPTLNNKYKEFEKTYVLELIEEAMSSIDNDRDVLNDFQGVITAPMKSVLLGKLRQVTSGAVYDEERNVHKIHDMKLEQLEEIIDTSDSETTLVFYHFRHAEERILKYLKKKFPDKTIKSLRGKQSDEIQDEWNAGNIDILLAHPMSCGHGLNLQKGGNVCVWYDVDWSLETYQQANARLYRQGQTKPTFIHHIVVRGTVDEYIVDILQGKATAQSSLLEETGKEAKHMMDDYIKSLVRKHKED